MRHQDALGGKGRRLQSRSLWVFPGAFTCQLRWRSDTLSKSLVILSNWSVSTLALVPFSKGRFKWIYSRGMVLLIIPALKRMRQEDC